MNNMLNWMIFILRQLPSYHYLRILLRFLQDFWEQFSHHLATIFLMVFSWMMNLVRVGTLVLCLHDIVDWMLEGAKLNRYLNNTFLCDLLFAMFTIGWFVTRLLMYPYL